MYLKKRIVLLMPLILAFILTACLNTRYIRNDRIKSFVKEIKNEHVAINSCFFAVRSRHTFSVRYASLSEIKDDEIEAIFQETQEFLCQNEDIIKGSEVGIKFKYYVDGNLEGCAYLTDKTNICDRDGWQFYD